VKTSCGARAAGLPRASPPRPLLDSDTCPRLSPAQVPAPRGSGEEARLRAAVAGAAEAPAEEALGAWRALLRWAREGGGGEEARAEALGVSLGPRETPSELHRPRPSPRSDRDSHGTRPRAACFSAAGKAKCKVLGGGSLCAENLPATGSSYGRSHRLHLRPGPVVGGEGEGPAPSSSARRGELSSRPARARKRGADARRGVMRASAPYAPSPPPPPPPPRARCRGNASPVLRLPWPRCEPPPPA